jgi:hypothetical protein
MPPDACRRLVHVMADLRELATGQRIRSMPLVPTGRLPPGAPR